MAGIDSLVNSRADMFAANPQGLQQRYAMNQDLLDLLALQKLKKDKEAAQRSLQMQMQPESGTVKDQLEGQMMQATKQEVASSLAPGIQQQGQAMQAQQLQQAMAGIASQPAPNMVGMARGGIVGYAPGGDVEGVPYSREALRAFDERRRLERELRAARVAEAEAKAIAQRYVEMMQNPPGRTPESDAAGYVDLMQNPPGRTPESDAAGYVDLMQRGKPSTTEAPAQTTQSTTPAAGIESLVAPRSAPSSGTVVMAPADRRSAEEAAMQATRYQGTDEDLASMLGEDLAPMQRAAPTAPTDPRMSRYEDQLARLEAEEKDKLGSLIDFLLAAGASGGTNLGATLMGGGSGLQAREQRIKAEMAQTVKNIEDLQFQRDEMQARREETAEDRALRLRLEQMGIASDEKRSADDRAVRLRLEQMGIASDEKRSADDRAVRRDELRQRADQFQQEFELTEDKFEEEKRQFGEDIALRNREASARELANNIAASLKDDTLNRAISNDEREELLNKVKVLNSTIETLQLTNPDAAKPYRAQLNRVYAALGMPITSTAAGEDDVYTAADAIIGD